MSLPADEEDRFSPIGVISFGGGNSAGLTSLGGFTAFGWKGSSIFGWMPSKIRNGSCFP